MCYYGPSVGFMKYFYGEGKFPARALFAFQMQKVHATAFEFSFCLSFFVQFDRSDFEW